MASPIEQNAKHVLILQKLFDSGLVNLPTRLGCTIKFARNIYCMICQTTV